MKLFIYSKYQNSNKMLQKNIDFDNLFEQINSTQTNNYCVSFRILKIENVDTNQYWHYCQKWIRKYDYYFGLRASFCKNLYIWHIVAWMAQVIACRNLYSNLVKDNHFSNEMRFVSNRMRWTHRKYQDPVYAPDIQLGSEGHSTHHACLLIITNFR
jgi:hypothetical protein